MLDANAGRIAGRSFPDGALRSGRVNIDGTDSEASRSASDFDSPRGRLRNPVAHFARLPWICMFGYIECTGLLLMGRSGEMLPVSIVLPSTHERLYRSPTSAPRRPGSRFPIWEGADSVSTFSASTLSAPFTAIKAAQRQLIAAVVQPKAADGENVAVALHSITEKKGLGGGGAKQQHATVMVPIVPSSAADSSNPSIAAPSVTALAFDPAGKLMFVAVKGGELIIFDLKAPAAPKELTRFGCSEIRADHKALPIERLRRWRF